MKIRWRHLAVAGSAVLLLLYHFRFGAWRHTDDLFHFDAADYYVYLPAGLIHHDWSLRFLDGIPGSWAGDVAPVPLENGQVVIKMYMGMAMMQTPFFLLGHAVASRSDIHAADGYSRPYTLAAVAGALFYFLLGLALLGRVLATWFDDRAVALTLLLVAWGTNVTFYLLRDPGMSHGFSFCLFAAFLALTIAWHRQPTRIRTMAIGLLYGLITLVRPTNGVIALVFMLWEVRNGSDLKNKAAFFWRQRGAILLMGLLALLVWVPQFLYWHRVTGHWLHYAYGPEGFFFLHPHVLDVLAGFRKGWLVYTPVMAFALLGLISLYRSLRPKFWAVVVFLLANVYVVSSWWCWWYGGSFGQRALIESYAVLALPLAALIERGLWKGRWGTAGVFLAAMALLGHNGFQLIQLKTGALHMENMTRAAYFRSLGRWQPTPEYQAELRAPDIALARKGRPESEWRTSP